MKTSKPEAGEFSRKIGRRIRWVREIHGLTQADMQKRTGIMGKTLARYETGVISISADAIESLCKGLNVSPVRLCAPLADFAWLIQEQVGLIENPTPIIPRSKDKGDGSP